MKRIFPSTLRASFAALIAPCLAFAMLSLLPRAAFAATDTWIGSGTSAFLSDGGNWLGGGVPASNDSMVFAGAGTTGTSLSDNLMVPASFNLAGLTFNTGAAAYLINPAAIGTNGFTLTGPVANNSSVLQTINDLVTLSGTQTFTTASGGGNLLFGGNISGLGGLTTAGSGVLTLSGANTFAGTVSVNAGTLVVSGPYNNGSVGAISSTGGTGNNINVGTAAASSGVLKISNNITAFDLNVGGNTTGNGAVFQTSGTANFVDGTNGSGATSPDRIVSIGGLGSTGTPGYGYYNISGGLLTARKIEVGSRNIGTEGVMDVSGGVVSTTNSNLNIARGNSAGANFGILNITGGSVLWDTTATAGVDMEMGFNANASETALGVVTVGGGGQSATLTGPATATAGSGLNLDIQTPTAGGTVISVVNLLSSGTLTTSQVAAAGVATYSALNFNGGTLKATTANTGAAFLAAANITKVNVFANGGTVDNNGTSITINNALVAPAGSGVTAIPVSAGGSGYIGAPIVNITGGGGTGATGYAVMSGSAVQSIVITNPGINYTSAPTVTLIGGGGTGATIGTVTTAANVSGGMTFQGAGTTTLSGANTYTGATNVNAGAVLLTGGGNVNGSSAIVINGATAKVVDNATTAVSIPITVTQGLLTGTGSVTNTVTVTAGTGGIVGNGNGTAAAFTIGNLTFSGSGALALTVPGGANTSFIPLAVTSALTTPNVAKTVTLNLTSTSSFLVGSTYDLLSYGTFSGAPTDFTIGSGISPRQIPSSTITVAGGLVTLTVGAGDIPQWTGAHGGIWTTVPTGSSTSATPNWTLKSTGTATDFFAGDVVEFDDTANVGGVATAPTTTTVTIQGGNVSPTSITFNNNALPYNIVSGDGSGIAGTTGITMNGTNKVTISSSNTFTGATAINAGTLQIGNGSVDGSISTTSSITDNGALIYDRLGSFSYSGVISGTGSLTMTGTGSQTLSGPNSFSGGVNINGGTLIMANASALGSSSNAITFGAASNATLVIGGNTLNTPDLNGDSTASILNNSASAGTLVITGSNTDTFNGTIGNGTGAGTLALSKTGPGILNLGGSNTFSGATTINAGVVNVSSALGAGPVNVDGTSSTSYAVLNLNGATVGTGANAMFVANGSPTQFGVVNQNGGSVNVNNFILGGNTNGASNVGYADYNLVNGTVINNSGNNRTRIGQTDGVGSVAIMYMSGTSVFTTNLGLAVNDSSATAQAGGGGDYVFYVSGGTVNATATNALGFGIGGKAGQAEVTVAGTGLINVTGTTSLGGSVAGTPNGTDSGRVAILNLGTGAAGGTLQTNTLNLNATDSPVGYLNFNGGTLKAQASSTAFLTGLTQATVFAGGGTIDNNGTNITIGQALGSPSGQGLLSITGSGGSGFIGTPYVSITGGNPLTPATAVAIMDGNGNVTGIQITNPGTGYGSAPTISFVGGGGTGGSFTANLGTVSGGGMTFAGTGNTTLGGTSSFSGATNVNAGHLVVSGLITGSTVNVAAGATLASGSTGFTNTIAPTNATSSAVVIGGALSPGDVNNIATINFTLQTGAKLNFQPGSSLLLDSGTTSLSDTVNFTSAGNWLLGSGNATLALNGAIDYTSTYVVFSNVTTPGFTFGAITGYDNVDFLAQFHQVGNNYDLTFQAVPEPGTYAMILGGVALLGFWQRLRRRSRA